MQNYYVAYTFLNKVKHDDGTVEWKDDEDEGIQVNQCTASSKEECLKDFIKGMGSEQFRVYSIEDEEEIYEDTDDDWDPIYDSTVGQINWDLI